MAKRSFFDDLDTLLGGRNRSSQTTKKVTWQQFLQKTSDNLDRMLIAHAKKEGLVYIGGKCRFTVTAAENNAEKFILNVDAELYYKDQFKAEKNFQIYPLHTEKPFEMFDMEDQETARQLEKLKTEQFEMTVEKPQINNTEE